MMHQEDLIQERGLQAADGSLDLRSCGKEKTESNSEQEEHHLKA